MNKFLKVIMVIFLIFLIILAGGIFYLTRGLDYVSNLSINKINLSVLEDGVYTGEYNYGRFSNKVRVEVRGNRVVDISLLKDVVFSKPEVTEELFNKIIESQNNNVDLISGSTVTSKAYLKAVENALKVKK